MSHSKTPKLLLIIFAFSCLISYSQKNLAEKLGYQADAKLLIIHADDVGVSHSENSASIAAMEKGPVNSASIMMPCPWVSEIASYAKNNPQADLGLHLTLTSEWETMKWGPVASKDKVKSLLNSDGFFYDGCETFEKNAKIAEVEIELRAQIEKAFKMGIKPTHLDTHMGCLRYNIELVGLYLKLGAEYKIPVLIDKATLGSLPSEVQALTEKDLALDKIMTASPEDFKDGMPGYYKKMLQEMRPGIQIFLIHTAFDDAEMQALTINHPDWGAAWRQADFDFFTSKTIKALLESESIKLVTWGQIQKVIYKN